MLTSKGLGRDLRRAVSWHRRLLAAGLAAASMAVALHLVEPTPPPTTTVLTVARDLPGGAQLTTADVREVALPRDLVPTGVLTPDDPGVGRMLAGPVRAGTPLTDVDLAGPALLRGQGADLVAAPVRVADAGALALVRVGDRIDLLAAETDAETADAPARFVVRGARVVVLPGSGRGLRDGGGDLEVPDASVGGVPEDLLSGSSTLGAGDVASAGLGGDGGLLVVAVPPEVAADLARAAVTARLSLVLRGSPAT
jgi:pilus assembly protein CpaB